MSQTHIQTHLELIAKHEQEFLARRTRAERMGDAITLFAGSVPFIAGQLALMGIWILWNTLAPRAHRFDPAPFALLATIVGVQAILLASFILNRQSRMSRRSEEREH